MKGKSDPTDAENAARSVLSGEATAIPKTQSDAAEAMRTISVARRSAVKAKTQAINQLRAILVSAPQEVRERLLKAKAEQCVAACARLRQLGETSLLQTLTTTLRLLAKRWLTLNAELKELDAALDQLTTQFAPHLREQFGVGPQTAAMLLAVAGDNPERLRSEAALAALCGVNPLPARIAVDLAPRYGKVQVAVDNQGEVPLSMRGRFFDKYARAGKVGGSGLGTYSIRLMAEIQGGRVAMEAGNGRTRLTVTLPAP